MECSWDKLKQDNKPPNPNILICIRILHKVLDVLLTVGRGSIMQHLETQENCVEFAWKDNRNQEKVNPHFPQLAHSAVGDNSLCLRSCDEAKTMFTETRPGAGN